MSKYIDAEKLKERVTRLIASARKNDWPIAEDYLRRVIDIIDSLQQEQPEPSCKNCGFYENNCPFIRGKFIPYPNKVCKDYIHSAMKEQKPAEWSEEDEIEHDYLCKLLRETWDKVDKGSCIDDAITWFEKLPERIYPHSWKPSEEQIGILGKVFAGCQLNDSERDSMVDLFYHLKDML